MDTNRMSCTADEASEVIRSLQRNSSKLGRFLRRYERNGFDIDDIMQDTAIEGLLHCDKFRGQSSIDTWLFGVAANVARHHVARQTRHASRETSLDAMQEDITAGRCLPDAMQEGITAGQCLPEKAAELRQTVDRLFATLDRLPVDLRTTLLLVCVEDLTYQEVAERLEIPIGTVRSRVNRAREQLRKEIGMAYA